MNPQVCTNCRNEKPVNATDNRLVTESCGHVKCMDCLLHEKTGCQACLREKSSHKFEETLNESLDEEFAEDSPPPGSDKCYDELDKEIQCEVYDEFYNKKKLETSHIKVETDSKPFRCKVCSRRFRRKDNLERHIRNTHPEYVPATAVDCDETILKQIQANGQTKLDDYQKDEKTKLEIMNPLPPLPEELMQKHMHESDKTQAKADEENTIDTSYILVANNARQSVIVGNKTANVEKAAANSPEQCEYVHKIRKASIIPLPPIDVRKMIELEEQTNLNNLDLGAPPKDKKTLYEKILYGDRDKKDSEEPSVDSGPEVHWRRKLKQSVSIDI
ncbi:hypothetical protein HF086_015869 [Spodoptera exigua]|uniref:C2H2-type domain-containing protein n=1 Tax=Spodoptera exigua TaxID=7107 RepID=A0A922S9V3_SPOEX|nr:hypothetical protein HF086_015869 [Spodoptera exigua]